MKILGVTRRRELANEVTTPTVDGTLFTMLTLAVRTRLRTLCFLAFLNADLTSGRNGGPSSNPRGPPAGNRGNTRVDRFVRAAPIIVGVRCSDGVLLLAAHTFDDDEPLLFFNPSVADQVASVDCDGPSDASTPGISSESFSSPPLSVYRNLPPHYAGPFRIQVINPTSCLAIASTGWRADCDDLVRTARGLAAHELSRCGPTPSAGAGMEAEADRRGTILSHDLSLSLSLCAVSENARARSCVGLLASPSSLWLIDSTGATPVRALCVGGGGTATPPAPSSDDEKNPALQQAVSDAVNEMLMQVQDWTLVDCRQALDELLNILGGGNDAPSSTGNSSPLLRHGTRLEVAFMGQSKVTRHRLTDGSVRIST